MRMWSVWPAFLSAWPAFLPLYTILSVIAQTTMPRDIVQIPSQHNHPLTGGGNYPTANDAALTLTRACPLTLLAEFRYE